VHVSGRFGALRVAPHVYNDKADVDALIRALEACGASGEADAARDGDARARL
jgi:selenocysteine lyase/cysteine desulfurase